MRCFDAYSMSSKSSRRAADPAIEAGHRRLGARIDENPEHLVDEIVSGRAGDRPIGQPFIAREDFFDDDVRPRRRRADAASRNTGPGRTTRRYGRCADPAPAAFDHSEDQPVRRLEQLRHFDAQPGEVVDVEKAPVVDLLGRDAPERDPIGLILEQPVQPPKASGRPGSPANAPTAASSAAAVSGSAAASASCRFSAAARWCAAQAAADAAPESAGQLAQFRAAMPQDIRVRQRTDRKAMLVIPGAEGALTRIEAQRDLASFENRAVLVAEHRQQNPALQIVPDRVPVDVEERRIGRILAPLQNVEPPGVVGAADPHVVRHDIDNEPHAVRRERRDQRLELGLGADLGVEPVVIDDVVAVRRAGPRLHQRRRIQMTDAEPGEIRDERLGVAEREPLVELQPVGCPNSDRFCARLAHWVRWGSSRGPDCGLARRRPIGDALA